MVRPAVQIRSHMGLPQWGTSRDSLFSLRHVGIRVLRQMFGDVLGFNDPLFVDCSYRSLQSMT
jgi:hypothetical protein